MLAAVLPLVALLAVFPSVAALLAWIGPSSPELSTSTAARTLTLSDSQVRYTDEGKGESAIVFLHGFNNQLSVWDLTVKALQSCKPAMTHRLIRLDIPGFGGSTVQNDSPLAYSLQTQAARVIELLDALKIKRAQFVGVSMGGSLAAQVAALSPDRVEGLLLLAPSGFPGSLHFGGRFGKLLSLPSDSVARRLALWVSSTAAYRAVFPRSVVFQALSVTQSYGDRWVETLGKIRAPTELLWSTGDQGVPYRFAAEVTQLIRGARLTTLPQEVGHDIPGTRPEMIAQHVCLKEGGVQ